MPAGRDPLTPDEDCHGMIEPDGDNRRSAAGDPPDDTRAVVTPGEVPRPSLAARVEELQSSPAPWISCVSLRPLVAVAHAAGEPEVPFVVAAAASARGDVVDLQRPKDIALRAGTVSAPVAGVPPYSFADAFWYAVAGHGVRGCRRPRRTASFNAPALRSRRSWYTCISVANSARSSVDRIPSCCFPSSALSRRSWL